MFRQTRVCGLCVAAFILIPATVTAQLVPVPPAGATADQIRFVGLAADWIVRAHAEEEAALYTVDSAATARVSEVRARVAEVESTVRRAEADVRKKRSALAELYREEQEHGGGMHGGMAAGDNPPQPYLQAGLRRELGETEAQLFRSQLSYQAALADLALVEVSQAAAREAIVNARSSNAADLRAFEEALQGWSAAAEPWGEDWFALTRAATTIAAANGSKPKVTYQTQPTANLVLYYQTVDERRSGAQPNTFNRPSNNIAYLDFGWYHVWYEVGGRPRSNRKRIYKIETKDVEIVVDIY